MPDTFSRTAVLMDTLVRIRVVRPPSEDECAARVERALEWFRQVEARCSRFDPHSEVMGLLARVGEPVPVSSMLFEAIRFALAVADASEGAFDPTVGHTLETRGFNRNYRTGQTVASGLTADERRDYRDVRVDPARQTVTLARPTIVDLGAVVKGMAIDLAARELQPYPDFAIDAGGDLFVRGRNPEGGLWRVGIRHPREPDELLGVVGVSDVAVCTSGDYERVSAGAAGEHHIVDPRTGHSAGTVASVTVIAPTAMVADALGTAAFVLGPERGVPFLERGGVEGLIVTTTLERYETREFGRYWQLGCRIDGDVTVGSV